MIEKDAIQLAKQYSRGLGIHVIKVNSVEYEYSGWWIFRSTIWTMVHLETQIGKVEVAIGNVGRTVHSFLPDPYNSSGEFLPLWLAFPESDVLGFKQGIEESYAFDWGQWYMTLTNNQKADYQLRYPEPQEPKLGWIGFYDRQE